MITTIITTMLVSLTFMSYPASYLICAACVCCEIIDMFDIIATVMLGTRSTPTCYDMVVKRLFHPSINVTVHAALLRLSVVHSVSYAFIYHLILNDPHAERNGVWMCVLFTTQATRDCLVKIHTYCKLERASKIAYNCPEPQTIQASGSTQSTQLLDSHRPRRDQRENTRFSEGDVWKHPARQTHQVSDNGRLSVEPTHTVYTQRFPTLKSSNERATPIPRGPSESGVLFGSLDDHHLHEITENHFPKRGLFDNVYTRVPKNIQHIVVIVSVGYSGVNKRDIVKLACKTDIDEVMRPFLNMVPETVFIVLTDDDAKLREICAKPNWASLHAPTKQNQYGYAQTKQNYNGHATRIQYGAVYKLLAQRTDEYKLITSIGAHGAERKHGGGVFLVSPNLHDIDIITASQLHELHAAFVQDRRESLYQAGKLVTVLYWTIVLDICYAKRAIRLPVNFTIKKHLVTGDVHVRIVRDDTFGVGQDTIQPMFDPREVVVICLYASAHDDEATEVYDEMKEGHRGQFSWLVHTPSVYHYAPFSMTLVKLVTGLNERGGNPVDMIIQFANRMDSGLSTTRDIPVYWSTNFPSAETANAFVAYNEDEAHRAVGRRIRDGKRVLD
ncbi:hypothetical protein T484DRAFT_1756139 [Baffinella frigidus]|nr:hypothetical protein T484DRAFT_1756139 [Cryptophyta sp. CCMP2293]